ACAHQQNQKSLRWIIAMQEMIYLKEVKFLDKITVSSQVVGWDHKYVYFTHRFLVKNQLMAVGITKVLLIKKQGACPPSEFNMVGEQLSDVIATWNTHQSAVKSTLSS